jgi:hypothetical protein
MTTTIRVPDQFATHIRNSSKDNETTAETVNRLYGDNTKTLEDKIKEIAEETVEDKCREIVIEEIDRLQNRY